MPVEFLSDEQAGVYGRFDGPPSLAELERFFFLDDADRELVARRRGEHNRLGFAVQLGTVRFLGTFLTDPLDVPWPVVEYLGRQLDVGDVSVVKAYAERRATQWEHTAEIRGVYGFVDFTAAEAGVRAFLDARAWTRPERPSELFDQAVAWLRAERVLLPGVSVLARTVAEVRAQVAERLHATLTGRVGGDLQRSLEGLLVVPDGARSSELERLRRAPTWASGREMVRALDRVAEVAAIGAGGVEVADVPPGRVQALARHGLTAKAAMLRRLPQERRTATLLATAGALGVEAVDDALDLFAVLMATKLIAPARRAAAKDRLRTLPALAKASTTLAVAARVLLELVEAAGAAPDDAPLDTAAAWARLQAAVPRDRLAAAVATVAELAPDDDDVDAGTRAELVARYASVRPFLAVLAQVLPLGCTDVGRPVLAAVQALPELVGRKRVGREEVDQALVTGSWRRLVLANPDLAEGVVDHRAYALCVLDALYRALRRRDVYAEGSKRWGDPRARLLDGPAWEQTRPQVLTALRLTEPAQTYLGGLARRLDAAYLDLAGRLGSPDERGAAGGAVRLEPGPDGRMRLHLARLQALDEPPTLVALRELVARMLPRVDLPEVLLEVDAWTGYLSEFSHVAESGTRMEDLATSLAAVLVAEGCNLGLAPVTKPGHPALTRDRLSHVGQNYLRTDTLAAANARLIGAQAQIDVAQLWGGGLVASVDGLRFVVPVRTLNSGPNPRYFGQGRGVTWLNAINDQVAGIGAVVVAGTMRDSLHVLDVILGRDGGPAPEVIATDTASYSDLVFGLFRLLGYQFSPRIADLPDQRLWRLTAPGAPQTDYGPLNAVATHHLSWAKMAEQWADMLRVAGSLHTGTVTGYDLVRMLGRDGRPSPLGAAFAEYGRAAKTLHLLAMCDPDDESYRRTVHTQLTVTESRHRPPFPARRCPPERPRPVQLHPARRGRPTTAPRSDRVRLSANVDRDNRKVDRLHAKQFGQYIENKKDWVAPALLARDGGGCVFEKVQGADAVGYLSIPRAIGGISSLRTIDGQHRVLGVHIEKQRITDAITGVDRDLARKQTADRQAKLQAERDRLIAQMQRLDEEYVGLDIYVEKDPIKAQQMFVDVADNARGISSAVRARFDNYKVANRTLGDVIEHPLFKGRIDAEQDRMTLKNPNLMGAKHIADITRAVVAGAGGRISKKAEQTLTDGEVIEQVKDFLDVISNAFVALAAVVEDDPDAERRDGELTKAQELRRSSLLGSVGMLRVLSGVFRELRSGETPAELDDITEFFKRLDRHMSAPISDTSIWRSSNTGCDFEPGAYAPIMRTQNIVHLVNVISGWYRKPPAAL